VQEAADLRRDAAHGPVAGGRETILLVEDEVQVRQVALAILRQLGYHVLEADTPEQALEHGTRFRGRIDLLLTDVVMPRLSGRQVADRIAILRPGIAVLFMSGYTDDAMLHHGVIDSGMAFVQKPLTPTALARKVRDVLDRRGGASAGRADVDQE
jgi:CheY-like chemotaxis protein